MDTISTDRRLLKTKRAREDDREAWLNKSCGVQSTRKHYTETLDKFLDWAALPLEEILKVWGTVRYDWKERERFKDELSELIQNYYGTLGSYAPRARNALVSPILSFFRGYKKIDLDFEYARHSYVKYHNRDLRKEEIRRILDHSSLRDRSFFLMMLESGLRPDTLTKLQYGQFREDFEAGIVPMKIDLASEVLKDRVSARWSFIGEDGFNVLKQYLKGRNLEDESYIFTARKKTMNFKGEDAPLGDKTFSSQFGRTVTSLGLAKKGKGLEERKPRQVRLYGLRKYFRNNMTCDSNYREWWMGHDIGTDEHYISRDVERHREEYLKGYANLRLHKPSIDAETIARLTRQNLALKAEGEELKAGVKLLEGRIKFLERANKRANERYQELSARVDRMIAALDKKRQQEPSS